MAKFEDNLSPYLTVVEQSGTPANPSAGDQKLFVRTSDHVLCYVNSSGTVTPVANASGAVATDTIWAAAGDLAVGTGSHTAAVLTKGSDSTVLTMSPTTHLPVYRTLAAPWAIYGENARHHVGFVPLGASNRAIYQPCTIFADCTVLGVMVSIGTSSGNICVGLYDSSLARVATSGSVASPGTGQQKIAFTGGYVAVPGRYYLAISADNNTVTFSAPTSGALNSPFDQPQWQATAFVLPNPAVFAGQVGVSPNLLGYITGGLP